MTDDGDDSDDTVLPKDVSNTTKHSQSRSQSSVRNHSQSQTKPASARHFHSDSEDSQDSDADLAIEDAQFDQENVMPPKNKKQSAKQAQAKLKAQQDEIARLKSELALREAQMSVREAQLSQPRGESPTEQAELAEAIVQSGKKAKKRRKSSLEEPAADLLSKTATMIRDTIKDPVWAVFKFATGDGTGNKLAGLVLKHGSKETLKPKARAKWYDSFTDPCVTQLNKQKSSVQSAIKGVFYTKWSKQENPDWGTVKRYENCLNRELDMDIDRDVADFDFYYGHLMTKATGTPNRWNEKHKGYFCLYNGHPPQKKENIDYYVTPETEAFTLLVIDGCLNIWAAQYQVTQKYPTYNHKLVAKAPTPEAIVESDAIKKRIYLKKHEIEEAELPDDWLVSMQFNFERTTPPTGMVRVSVLICPFCLITLAMFSPMFGHLFRQVLLSEKPNPAIEGGMQGYAALHGPVFRNPYSKATAGQQNYTGLTNAGKAKWKDYKAAAIAVRKDKAKRKFERDHLEHYKEKFGIECSTYEAEEKRRKRNNPTEGVAQDDPEELEWDDSELYPDEVYSDDGDDSEDDD